MQRIANIAAVVLTAGVLIMPATVLAFGDGTPDEQPAAEESICNPDAGLRGAAYGLCVAYCEANDCELAPEQHACDVLLENFYQRTGSTAVPCVTVFPEVR